MSKSVLNYIILDVTNPARDRSKYADPSGETMKALLWMGKNKVELRKSPENTHS